MLKDRLASRGIDVYVFLFVLASCLKYSSTSLGTNKITPKPRGVGVVRALWQRHHVSVLLSINFELFIISVYFVLLGTWRPGTISLLLRNPSTYVIETYAWHPRDARRTVSTRRFEGIPMPWWPVLPVNHQEDPQGCSFGKPPGVGNSLLNVLFLLFQFNSPNMVEGDDPHTWMPGI